MNRETRTAVIQTAGHIQAVEWNGQKQRVARMLQARSSVRHRGRRKGWHHLPHGFVNPESVMTNLSSGLSSGVERTGLHRLPKKSLFSLKSAVMLSLRLS